MWGVVHENSNKMKVRDVVNVFPIYTAVDCFDCHILPFLFDNASDVICAGLAIVEAKCSTRRSVPQDILLPQPVLENTLVPLDVIRNLAEFHLSPCCSIPLL